MPYALVNYGPLQVRLHYELLVGPAAWEELAAQELAPRAVPARGDGERLLSLDLVEKGGLEGAEAAERARWAA